MFGNTQNYELSINQNKIKGASILSKIYETRVGN